MPLGLFCLHNCHPLQTRSLVPLLRNFIALFALYRASPPPSFLPQIYHCFVIAVPRLPHYSLQTKRQRHEVPLYSTSYRQVHPSIFVPWLSLLTKRLRHFPKLFNAQWFIRGFYPSFNPLPHFALLLKQKGKDRKHLCNQNSPIDDFPPTVDLTIT